MILEAAILNVRAGQEQAFETAFTAASPIIAATQGYISHELQRCIETTGRYLLLVQWQTLESHTVNFRDSANYVEWKKRLHRFYDPFPVVEHYETALRFPPGD